MPRAPLHFCTAPGCRTKVERGRCEHHAVEAGAGRTGRSGAQGVYSQRWWKQHARAFLDLNPWCIDCDAPSTVADHAPRSRAQLIAAGVPDPDAFHRLQPRCASCHSRRTVLEDGGFGRAPVHRR